MVKSRDLTDHLNTGHFGLLTGFKSPSSKPPFHYWCAPGTRSHLHVPRDTGSGKMCSFPYIEPNPWKLQGGRWVQRNIHLFENIIIYQTMIKITIYVHQSLFSGQKSQNCTSKQHGNCTSTQRFISKAISSPSPTWQFYPHPILRLPEVSGAVI